MSNMQMSELPLGHSSAIERARAGEGSDLAWVWDAIDVWYGYLQNADQAGIKAIASLIMLACMYIPLRIAQLGQDTFNLVDARVINRAIQATRTALWARIKDQFDGTPDWFNEVMSQATIASIMVFKMRDTIEVPQIWRALDMWKLLQLYTKDGITTTPVTYLGPRIEDGMRHLRHQLEVRDINYVLRIPPGVWTMPMMDVFDPTVGFAPLDGRTKAPGILTGKDLVSLMPGEWVTESAVDGYMALLCHSRNRHFQNQAELPASPDWHAWVSHTAWAIKTDQANPVAAVGEQWPPALYPNAKLEDVGYHFFPICDQSHWCMVVVRKVNGKWFVKFFSSKPGFYITIMSAWQLLREYLHLASNGKLGLRETAISPLRFQPMQDNGNDCGVFVLGAVRQELKDRKLEELAPSAIPAFRKRIIFELQCWKEIV